MKNIKYKLFQIKWILFVFIFPNLQAQVLSNRGAVLSVLPGTTAGNISVVNNTNGTISNEGIISVLNNINNGGTLSGNGLLTIGGSFINTGTFTAGTGTVNFNGTTSQSIPPLIFHHFILNNSSGAALSGTAIINGTLSLSSGNLAIGANTLTFQNSNTPLIRTAGTLNSSPSSNLIFGTSGNTGGAAFTIPSGIFTTAPILNNLTINRLNSLTLGNQILSLRGILLSNGPLNTNGNLTLLSDAAQTAMIDGSGTGIVSGNVTMQGDLPLGFGYKYLSSPFQAATVNELAAEVNLTAAFPPFYRNDENLTTAGWVKYVNPAGILNPMQGYAVNLGSSLSPKTIDMSGVVNNGALSINLFNHNQTYTQGFNLVGNPYPSPIDWNGVGGWTKTNIDNALYFFNASSTDVYGGIYSSYINGISSDGGTSSNIMPAMQGFFVHVSNGAFPVLASLGINNAARTTLFPAAKILKGKGEIISSSSAGFNQSDAVGGKSMLRLQATYDQENLVSDQAVIYFDEQSSPKFDKEYDALKLMNTDTSVPNLYTISSDALQLSINALPTSADSVNHVPIGLKIEKNGYVSFKVSNLKNLRSGLKVYLLDAQNNSTHDLLQGPAYRVNLKAGKYDNRFSIMFSLKQAAVQLNPENTFSAYYSGGKLVYQLKGLPENSRGKLLITNMNGQVLNRSDFMGPEVRELQIQLTPGIYVVSSISDKELQYKKILVN